MVNNSNSPQGELTGGWETPGVGEVHPQSRQLTEETKTWRFILDFKGCQKEKKLFSRFSVSSLEHIVKLR